MSNYNNYYKRIIDKNQNGLKLVLGGTGLGKTSSIVQVIKDHPKSDHRKFIYIANRVQLLDEMFSNDLKGTTVFLRNDTDTLVNMIERRDLNKLFDKEIIKKYILYHNKTQSFKIDIASAKRHLKFIKDNKKSIIALPDEESFRNKISYVINIFKTIVRQAKLQSMLEPNKVYNLTQHDYMNLIRIEEIKELFPYIHFRENPEKKFLLLTLQKAFLGFFDGDKNITLTNMEDINGNYIIFLDEFDFLENDLITLISQDYQIENPFDFVSTFYQRMTKNKLSSSEYLSDEKYKVIREKIESISRKIDNLSNKYGIEYPEINHFVTKDMEIRGKSIFQSNYSIVNKKICIEKANERENTFNLTSDNNQKNATILFNIVNAATLSIIRLFNDLEINHPSIYPEIVSHCFENTVFKDLIRKVRRVSKKSKSQETNYGEMFCNGFGLYEIERRSELTDPDEVNFNYFSINNTPEKALLQLSKNNLVFGLSATANIDRVLRNFDLNWLKEQFSDDFIYFDLTKEDQEDISKANISKQSKRGNKVLLEDAALLDNKDKLSAFLEQFSIINSHLFSGGGKKKDQKLKRLNHFFSTLKWIINNQEKNISKTHLLFFSSFKEIKDLFDNERENEDSLYKIKTKGENKEDIFQFYEITIPGNSDSKEYSFNIVFYNARFAKSLANESNLKQQYEKLFWEEKPVLVITTYPSAGNGINLQFYQSEQGLINKDESLLKDFANIHLLDSPYFYFNGTNEDQIYHERNSAIKFDLYSLSKLLNAKIISENQFKSQLNNIRHLNYFNNSYLNKEDGKLNQISVFIQALGRIERVWSKMDDQIIRLDKDVYNIFQEFCTNPDFEFIKENVKQYTSNNISQLFKLIEEKNINITYDIDDTKDDFLEDINNKCIESVNGLLNDLRDFRSGSSNEAEEKWLRIRRAALKHDFESDDLKKINCVFRTDYYSDGKLSINGKKQIISPELWHSDFKEWNLNGIYNAVNQNETVREYFKSRGYELKFSNFKKFFTPYFYQAILSGAIGEEAIKAIFDKEKINLDDNIPQKLFELIDTKIDGQPWYIDCKNFSENTLIYFNLPEDDPLWSPQLNDEKFKIKAIDKLKKLQNYHIENSDSCKLIYINFVANKERTLRYFNNEFKEIPTNNFEKAKIIVVQGVLESQNKHKYSNNFNIFIEEVKNKLNEITSI